jgi:hypothetical protein
MQETAQKKAFVNDEKKVEFDLSVRDFDQAPSRISDADDLDEKTIMYIEKQIRGSHEYRAYVKYLKEELDLTKCALLPSIDVKATPVSLEFHHFPYTLFDITGIVGRSMVSEAGDDADVSTFDIAERVMREHFENHVGLVPLTETLHQMAHSGAVSIPFDKINGNFRAFSERYSEFIEPDFLDRVEALEKYNASEEAAGHNKFKLEKRIANYNVKYEREDNEDGTVQQDEDSDN